MTSPLQLTPLPFETRIAEIEGPVLVEHAGNGFVVVEIERTGDLASFCITDRDRGVPSWTQPIPQQRELGDALVRMLSHKPLRAFCLPGGFVEKDQSASVWGWRAAGVWLAVALAVPIVAFITNPTLLSVLLSACVLLGLGAGFVPESWLGVPKHRYIAGDGTPVPLPDLRTNRLNIVSREFNQAAVEQIKHEYGQLLTDLTYRIEHSAMFDAAVPETSAFNAAMIRWDDTADLADDVTQAELAARVRSSFEAAKANAELLGLEHLPETKRQDGARALKAARLALASSGGERANALRAAEQLLGSMGLYYLPRATEVRAILQGRVRRALPGRREGD